MFLNLIYKNFLEAVDKKRENVIDIGNGWVTERNNYFLLTDFSWQKIRSAPNDPLIEWLTSGVFFSNTMLVPTLIFRHHKSTTRFVLTYKRRNKLFFRMYYSCLNKNKFAFDDPHISIRDRINGDFCHDGFSFSSEYYYADNEFFKQVYLKNMHIITHSKNKHLYNEFEVLINPRAGK